MLDTKTDQEILADGQAFYAKRLKSVLEPAHTGEYVVIDIDQEIYEVAADMLEAHDRIHARGSSGRRVCLRVGYPFAIDLYRGGALRVPDR